MRVLRIVLVVLVLLLGWLQYRLWFGIGGAREVSQLESQVAQQAHQNKGLRERNAALAAGQLEGGAQLETLGLRDTFYGAFGLRAGFGFGSQYSHEQPRNYFVASVTYGLRSAPYREDYFRGLARSLPRTGAAAVVRVVFSARHFYEQRAQPEQATAPSWSLHLGLELSPSYLWNLYLYPRERPWRCRAYVLFFC